MRPPTIGGEIVANLAAPLLSFIVVNWNYAHFIGQTLDSIRQQDYPDFECLVVDNGSNDDSLEVIARHVGADNRFRVIALPENLGQLGGVFAGLRLASGAFVALIDADDILLPSFASVHIQVHLSLRDNVAITSSNVVEIDSLNKVLSSSCADLRPAPRDDKGALRDEELVVRLPAVSSEFYCSQLTKHVSAIPRQAAGWHWSPGTSNVLRRSIVDLFVVAEETPRMRPADNYFFKLCHAFAGTAIIDMPLSARRIHGANYFTRREAMPNLHSGFPEFIALMKNNVRENLEIVLQHPARNSSLLGTDFWRVIDQLTERKGLSRWKYYRNPDVVAIFRHSAAELRQTGGTVRFIKNIFLRFGVRDSLSILKAAFARPGRQ